MLHYQNQEAVIQQLSMALLEGLYILIKTSVFIHGFNVY